MTLGLIVVFGFHFGSRVLVQGVSRPVQLVSQDLCHESAISGVLLVLLLLD